jgi:AcrR family transcriptional regulator
MTTATEAPASRQVGRPRDPRVDTAIVDATLQLLADGGYTSLTMEAVARWPAVGKATLYRRYTGKEQLVIDAVATMSEPAEVVQGASVRDELVARLEAVRRTSDSSLAGQLFPRLDQRQRRQPRAHAQLPPPGLARAASAFAAALQRGIDEGLVRPTSTSTTPSTCSSARWPTATSSAPTRRPARSSPPRRRRRPRRARAPARPLLGLHGGPRMTAPTAPSPGAPTLTHRQILVVLSGLLLGMFLAALDQTVVSTAMRTIADELNGQTAQAWVTTAYLITSTISTPLYGKLSDQYGRKPFYLAAIVVFVVGSVLCGMAQSIYELAAYRAVQGLGAGGLMSLAFAIVGDLVPPRERGRYQGWFMAVFGTSSVLGPVLGGAFAGQDTLLGIDGWRWIFFVNVPIGMVALVVVSRVLTLPRKTSEARIDFLGAALLTSTIVPVLLVAEKGREWGGAPASRSG